MSTSGAKVALVTGASKGGIGFHLCKSLLDRGFIVYAAARSLKAIADLDHPNVRKVILDVTNDQQVEATFQSLYDHEQRLDLVINNAGTFSTGPLAHNTVEEFKYLLDVNVVSLLRVCRAAVPYMAQRRRGTIVNMGSIAGYLPTPWAGLYESSKAAARVFTEVLEMECRPFDVHVVLVEPGSVESRICDNHRDYTPPPDSVYTGLIKSIRNRVISSRSGCMPGDVFAELLTPKLIRSHPPKYILEGNRWLVFFILSCLPRAWALSVLYFVMVTLQRK